MALQSLAGQRRSPQRRRRQHGQLRRRHVRRPGRHRQRLRSTPRLRRSGRCLQRHQVSFGLEAAAVQAACVAEAFKPDASVASIIDAALTVAKDGTADCIAAVADLASTLTDWRAAIVPLREIMRDYDTSPDDAKNERGNGSNDWTPSREHSIEELPIALGLLIVADGDFEGTIMGGANYGRDNDSIAGMGGAIAGALHGIDALRPQWIAQINSANRIDLMPIAADMAGLARKLQAEQLAAAERRRAAFAALGG